MPDVASLRVDLSASRLERGVRAMAVALTAAAAAACLWAFVLSPGPWRVAAAFAALASAAIALRGRGAAAPGQLAIGADGGLRLYADDCSAAASVHYCSAGFVCLNVGGNRLPIWVDALPATAWRRLQVACRWPQPQDAEPGAGSSSRGGRTK